MKTFQFAFIFLLLLSKAFGQSFHFSIDRKADSLWLTQLIAHQSTPPPFDTSKVYQFRTIWINGPVTYSPDSCLRIGQIGATIDSTNVFQYITAVQYKTGDKVAELKLPTDTDNYDFQDFPVTQIYKLPNRVNAHLIISSKEELTDSEGKRFNVPSYLPDSLMLKKRFSVATMVQVSGDSLKEVGFKADTITQFLDEQKTPDISADNSMFIDSYAPTTKGGITPGLHYDPAKKELTFLTTYCGDSGNDEGCNIKYLNVYAGTFKYTDSTFKLVTDSSYFSPALESLDTVIATRTLKTGDCTTKITASYKYEWVGQSVLQVLHLDYAVGNQKFGVVRMLDEDTTQSFLTPDYKVQKNGDPIFLIQNSTTPNRDGRCGRCEYIDSQFWIANKTSSRRLFTYSTDSDANPATYTYTDSKGDHNGSFYLKSPSESRENAIDVTIDKEHWQNNSTYVVRVSNETLSRNFYIHFVTANHKSTASVTTGKLRHTKQK